jgi:protein-S-isoprenylcysteine O-methyltransferase Ste14
LPPSLRSLTEIASWARRLWIAIVNAGIEARYHRLYVAGKRIKGDAMTSAPSDPRPAPLVVKIPTPVWVVVFMIAAIALNGVFDWPALGSLHSVPVGTLIILAGGALAAWGRMTFAAAKTQVNPASHRNDRLVETGPFKFTRNPMYLGMVIIALGAAVLGGLAPLFAVPVLTFLLDNFIIIPFEEAKMERQYGETFRAYKARVRRWI